MNTHAFHRPGAFADTLEFRAELQRLGLDIPCDDSLDKNGQSPMARSMSTETLEFSNRFCIQPMEGWDATPDGQPTDHTFHRWRRFGQSGASLIWGGEAVSVTPGGRSSPRQLVINEKTVQALDRLRHATVSEHHKSTISSTRPVIGLQLNHSGRMSRPLEKSAPVIAFHHPVLDRRMGIDDSYPLLTDDEIERIRDSFIQGARLAWKAGFDFVDIKACHSYLGHELLCAHTRKGSYGGSLENRTRFLTEIITGIRCEVKNMAIGVRLGAFDPVPYMPDPAQSSPGHAGPGIPEPYEDHLPWLYGFGTDMDNPLKPDLYEPLRLVAILRGLGVQMINISLGSPYFSPHVTRPAARPPVGGYFPPENPLDGVARHIDITRQVKQAYPDMTVIGSGWSYLGKFLPNVAQAVIRRGWADFVGLGRMVLSYPDLPADVLEKGTINRKLICRTCSDCTSSVRSGLVSGCYMLDPHYASSPAGSHFRRIKREKLTSTQ